MIRIDLYDFQFINLEMSSIAKKPKIDAKLKWTAILADEYFVDKFTCKSFMKAEIHDNKLLSSLINKLQEIYPLSSYKFKRVKKVERKTGETQDKYEILLSEKVEYNGLPENLRQTLFNVSDVNLPIDKILTKKQFDIVSKTFWPCSFHLNKYIESLIDQSFFQSKLNTQLVESCDFYARLALKLAVFKKAKTAAIIVDPRTDR